MPEVEAVSSSASGASWSNPTGALVAGGLYAENVAFGGTGFLAIGFDTPIIPLLSEVVGFRIDFDAGIYAFTDPPDIELPGTFARIEIGPSKDGSSFAGGYSSVYVGGLIASRSAGGFTELFGVEWSASEVNSGNFRILLRRGTEGDESNTTRRLIDSLTLTVYYNPEGGSLIMGRRTTSLQRVLIGKEVTPGDGAAATIRIKSANVQPMPAMEFRERRSPGSKFPLGFDLMAEHSEVSIEGVPDYEEMGRWLASLYGVPASALYSGSIYRHTFNVNANQADTIQTYAIEYGHPDQRAHKVPYAFAVNLSIETSRKDMTMTGRMLAQEIEDGITMSPGTDEVQTVALTGVPTGGSFKLSYLGAVTASIAYDAAAAAVETALNDLPTIGASGVSVAGASAPWTVTFDGAAFAGKNVAQLKLDTNALTGGSTPSVTITETTRGGYDEATIYPIMPGNVSIYMAETYAGLAAGKLTGCHVVGFDFGDKAGTRWVLNDTNDSFDGHVELNANCAVRLLLEANSDGMALLVGARAGTTKYIKIEAVDADGRRFQVNLASKASNPVTYKDEGGVYAVEYTFSAVDDPTEGYATYIILDNELAAY